MAPSDIDTRYRETYNDCDKQVLKSVQNLGNAFNKKCMEAYPPLNSGDGLVSQNYCTYEPSILSQMVLYPQREKIVDQNGNTAIIKNEGFSVTVQFFGRDKATLEKILQNTTIQALKGSQWTTKRALVPTDYSQISNIRTYHATDCGHGFAKYKKSWDQAIKLETIVKAGLRVQVVPGSPRPAPDSFLTGTPTGPANPINPIDPLSPRGGLEPLPLGGDERFQQDLLEAATNRAVKDLESAASSTVKDCPDKVLPYYWTTVFFQYSPELSETQIRLHVASNLKGPKDLILTDQFKVYLAAASHFQMPNTDGNRSFSFELFASDEFSLAGNRYGKAVVYNKDDLSVKHRAYFFTPNNSYPATVNNRIVTKTIATGTFPFTKHYDDDLNDIKKDAFSPPELNPLLIRSGTKVAYRLEIEGGSAAPTFVSKTGSFIMPPPLTFALMGDSFSSGQGAPVTSSSNPWIDDNSHRSRYSGLYRGVNRFIRRSNKACNYVFVACEGATIQDLVDQAQRRDHNPDGTFRVPTLLDPQPNPIKQNKPQVDLIVDWMREKGYDHITCALFGIGGNNVAFAEVIKSAISGGWDIPGMGVDSALIKKNVDDGFKYINGLDGYKRLDRILRNKLKVKNIVVLGYPDVTHDSKGNICKTDCPKLSDWNTFSENEMKYGADLQDRLNQSVRTAATIPGWRYADIFNATKNHGICVCEDMYITTWDAATDPFGDLCEPCSKGEGSLLMGASCSFHPTKLGYEQYIGPIVEQLNSLYGG